MRRKKPFVLLEILIGFTLVSVSILPFLRYPFRHMREELNMLFEMQITRHAQERLCEIEREFIQQQIDGGLAFPDEIKKKKRISQGTVSIPLPNEWERSYHEVVEVECTAQRKDQEFHYALIHIYLTYETKGQDKMEFHTELVAQKKA